MTRAADVRRTAAALREHASPRGEVVPSSVLEEAARLLEELLGAAGEAAESSRCPDQHDRWAERTAGQVARLAEESRRAGGWVSAIDYRIRFRTSRAQANHILRRAWEYGALERVPLRTVLDPAGHNESYWAYRRPPGA